MLTKLSTRLSFLLLVLVGVSGIAARLVAQSDTSTAPTILTRDQSAAILPATVFYRGRSASIQGRNSAGIKLPGDKFVLAAMVDTSGYSSTVQETYQAYLITEVPLTLGGQSLAPGAYGMGFIAGDHFVVMDLGAHQLLNVSSTHDKGLARPNPLQILPDASTPGTFRLYAGRSFVTLAVADGAK